MRKLSHLLLAAALSTLAFSTLTVTTCAADDGDSIKTGRLPYKPGRQIDDDASASPSYDGSESVKSGSAPYKPGRQIDDGASADGADAAPSAAQSDEGSEPVKPGRAPYKPGRQADE